MADKVACLLTQGLIHSNGVLAAAARHVFTSILRLKSWEKTHLFVVSEHSSAMWKVVFIENRMGHLGDDIQQRIAHT